MGHLELRQQIYALEHCLLKSLTFDLICESLHTVLDGVLVGFIYELLLAKINFINNSSNRSNLYDDCAEALGIISQILNFA